MSTPSTTGPPIRRTPLHRATVTAVTDLTPRMRRITVTAPSLVGLAITPAQDVELVLAEAGGRRVKRRYTVRHARPEAGEWDLDALLHGHGPGAQWAATAQPGSEISFFGPRGRQRLTEAVWNLFVGDESSLPAIASLVEALPPGSRASVYLEVTDASDELPIAAPEVDLGLSWVHRGEHPAGTPTLLAPHLEAFVATGPSVGHAYLLGESRSVVALRALLDPLNLGMQEIFTKGYWNALPARS